MYLKNYQVKVVSALKKFLTSADKQRAALLPIIKQFPKMKSELDFVKLTFDELALPYHDNRIK